jgi:Tfp pilus assembly protein PilN
MKIVNLSSHPLVNAGPVVRLTTVLWLLGLALLAMNLYNYVVYWVDSAEVRGEVAEVDAQFREEEENLEAKLQEIDRFFTGVSLAEDNGRADFLNELIRRRTFPWSDLFDQIEMVLPTEVRVTDVEPTIRVEDGVKKRQAANRTARAAEKRRQRQGRGRGRDQEPKPVEAVVQHQVPREEVDLNITGYARTEEAILEFHDTLQEHGSFKNPFLLSENHEETGQVEYRISVTYLLRGRSADEEATPVALAEAGDSPALEPPVTEVVAGAGDPVKPAAPGEPKATAPPISRSPSEASREAVTSQVAPPRVPAVPKDRAASRPEPRPAQPAPTTLPRASAPRPAQGLQPAPAAPPTTGLRPVPPVSPRSPGIRPPEGRPPANPAPQRTRPVPRSTPISPGAAPASPRTPPPPPVRPTYVGPAASGTPRLSGGGR